MNMDSDFNLGNVGICQSCGGLVMGNALKTHVRSQHSDMGQVRFHLNGMIKHVSKDEYTS
jgi:hypothetical protein